MMRLEISCQLRGKAIRARPLIESCMHTLERRCAVAISGPARCRVRVFRGYKDGHTETHQPRRVIAFVELFIPGWGAPFVAHHEDRRLRPAVAGAAASIEKMLRRASRIRETRRKREKRHEARPHDSVA